MFHWLRSLRRYFGASAAGSRRREVMRRRPARPALETLEDRTVPTTVAPAVTASYFDNAIYEFNPNTGALLSTLVPPNGSQTVLSGPAGLTVGPDGNLYISSQNNNSIVEFNVGTNTLSTFIGSSVLGPIATANGDSAFAPAGLRFGPDGDLYVSLNGGHYATSGGAVVRFDMTTSGGQSTYAGTYATVATGLIQPTEMTFGTAANDLDSLYVSNSGADDIVKITHAVAASPTTSTFIAPGSGGLANGVLNYPSGLTWQNGQLYVADLGATSGFGQVLRFNANGTFNEVFANKTHLPEAFPSDVAFNSAGDLLSADLGPNYPPNLEGSITEFNSSGTFLTNFLSSTQFPNTGTGESGISPSQLALNLGDTAPTVNAGGPYTINDGSALTLHAAATDPAGNPLTYSWDINGDGTFGDATGANPTITWAQLVALGVDNYQGTYNVRVMVSDGHGQVVTSAPVTLTLNYTPPTVQPLVATSYYDSAVYEFNPTTGVLMNTLVAPNSQSVLSGPGGVTVGPDGNLYISSQGNDSIVEYNVTTQSLSTFISASVLGPIATSNGDSVFGPAGITFGPDGDLYVALSAANGTTAPTGLGGVVRFDISNTGGALAYGGQSSIIASAPTENAPAGLIDPTGMTFGVGASNIDTLYVSDSGVGSVVAIPHAIAQTPGTMTTFIAAGSGAPGHTLNYPSGLSWAPNGVLEVVDLGATTGQGQILTFKVPTAPASTSITAGSNNQALPQSTIDVKSTAGFPSSGSLFINAIDTTVTYTGKTATSFTGVSEGTGTLATGETITSTVALGQYVGSFAQPLSRLNLAFPSDAVFTSSGQLLSADLGPSASNGQGTIDEFASNGVFIRTLVGASGVTSASSDFTPSQLTLNLGNMAPTVSISGNYSVNEGSSVTLHATGTDAQGFPLTYTWDINGDGAFGQATGANPTLTWAQLVSLGVDFSGTFTVTVIASDGHGQVAMSKPVTLTVDYTPVAGPGMVVTSFFDGAVYEFGAKGNLLDTLVAPYSNQGAILTNPAGVADGPDGNLYISNQVAYPPPGAASTGESIVLENLSTNTLSTFIPTSVLEPIAASIGDTQFVPAGITFGPDGNLYVALNGGYDGNPDVGANAATPGAVVRFDIANDNGVLTYTGSYSVIATTVGGNPLLEPSGIAFGTGASDMDNLYVANSGGGYAPGNIVKITDATGANPTTSVFVKAGAEGLSFPEAVVFQKNGDLLVTDFGGSAAIAAGRIERYGPNGQTLTPLVTNMVSQFPSDSALTSAGNLVVADLGPNYPPNLLGSIHEYSAAGVSLGVLDSSSQFAVVNPGDSGYPSDSGFAPSAIVVNAGTRAPVVNPGTGYTIKEGSSLTLSVQAQDPNGSALTYSWDVNGDGTFGDATGKSPTLTWAQLVTLGIDYPGTWQVEVMVADADGHVVTSGAVPLTVTFAPITFQSLVAASYFDNAIYQVNPTTGAVLNALVAPNSSQTVLSGPAGVTVGPDGNLYISSQNNNSIVEFNVKTGTLSTFISSAVIGAHAPDPAGLLFGPDGNLYVASSGAGTVVQFDITSNSGTLTFAGSYAAVASGLNDPTEMAFGTAANDLYSLYVSNSGADTVVKIADVTTSPTMSTFIAPGTGGLGASAMNYPSGLTWHNGLLYVVDLGATSYAGQVLLFNANGTFDKVFAAKTHLEGAFPSAAVFNAAGDLLTADLGPNYPPSLKGSIAEFNSAGTFLTTLVSSNAFAFTGPGTSGFSPSQLTLGLGDVAPTVSAGGPYTVLAGHALALQAVSSDPDGDSLTYSWDINGNLGAATTSSVLLSWPELQALGITGPGTFSIQVLVSDGHGQVVTSAPVTLTVTP